MKTFQASQWFVNPKLNAVGETSNYSGMSEHGGEGGSAPPALED